MPIEHQQKTTTDKERLAILESRMESLKDWVSSIKDEQKCFVTKDQFLPVKLIVYGLIALIGSSVVASLLGRIFIK